MIAFSGHLIADKLPFDLLTCTCSPAHLRF